jgi:Domain of unknown function (DUF4062)
MSPFEIRLRPTGSPPTGLMGSPSRTTTAAPRPDSVPMRAIMISSTRKDLGPYCDRASQVIQRVASQRTNRIALREISMEEMPQTGAREFAVEISKQWVDESDWVILIVGYNYGTISDEEGADGLSVTEWEYRHAFKMEKKIFVFLPEQANYAPANSDEPNLMRWGLDQSEDQRKKLSAFRTLVATPHSAFFRNIDDFAGQLEKTLHWAIDGLPPPIDRDGNLAQLLLTVSPEITERNRQVKRLADCKRIHDLLHELRIQAILTIRNIVFVEWKDNPGALSQQIERRLNSAWQKAVRLLTIVEECAGGLDDSKDELKRLLEYLIDGRTLWDPEMPDVCFGTFADSFDDFSASLQEAFESANAAMQDDANVLGDLHHILVDRIEAARNRNVLNDADEAVLREQMQLLSARHERLQHVLRAHDQWQRIHDKLNRIARQRGTQLFEKDLQRFARAEADTLRRLVEAELDALDAGLQGVGGQNALLSVEGPSRTGTSSPDYKKNLQEELERLGPCLQALKFEPTMEHFDVMQAPFDQAFYFIDKLTYAEVERARERVLDLDRLMRDLIAPLAMTRKVA